MTSNIIKQVEMKKVKWTGSIEDFKHNVKLVRLLNIVVSIKEFADPMHIIEKPARPCQVCGKMAKLEEVEGYVFNMCPHCAYMTRIHATKSHDSYSE